MTDKSSYLQLYDLEASAGDGYRLQIENKQAGISVKDSNNVRPMKFYAKSFKFYEGGVTPGDGYDLEVRLDDADAAAAAAQADADTNTIAVAAEAVSRIAGDATVSANLNAEIVARAAAVALCQADVDQNEADGDAGRAVNAAAIVSEASARVSGDTAEAAARVAGDAALQLQITNILSNATAGSLDSLAEIVAAFQAADSTLSGTVGAMNTRLLSVEAQLAELTNQ